MHTYNKYNKYKTLYKQMSGSESKDPNTTTSKTPQEIEELIATSSQEERAYLRHILETTDSPEDQSIVTINIFNPNGEKLEELPIRNNTSIRGLKRLISYLIDNSNLIFLYRHGEEEALDDSVNYTWRDGDTIFMVEKERDEKQILIDFYHQCNDIANEGWFDSDNWLSDRNLNTWEGISTSDHGFVTFIDLNDNNLSGRLPDNITELVSLKLLKFNLNRLSGKIPNTIGNLENLLVLDLSHNKLTRSIPNIGNLRQLQMLNLEKNKLRGPIPLEIGLLTNLNILNLSKNKLEGTIPVDFGKLSSLVKLRLDKNRLRGAIPDTIRNLQNLLLLTASHNALNGAYSRKYWTSKKTK